MIEYFVFVPLAYLLGSLPFGLIAGRLFGGVDVRDHGSGNTGMTNVMRTVNTPTAILVLALDMAKGAGAALLVRFVVGDPLLEALAAAAAVAGHSWSIFMRMSGGKGTATGWGALLALYPPAGVAAAVAGLGAIAATRHVSLGSLLAAAVGSVAVIAAVALWQQPAPYALYVALAAPIIFIRHRENILNLIRGEERKIGRKTESGPEEASRRGKGFRWPRSA